MLLDGGIMEWQLLFFILRPMIGWLAWSCCLEWLIHCYCSWIGLGCLAIDIRTPYQSAKVSLTTKTGIVKGTLQVDFFFFLLREYEKTSSADTDPLTSTHPMTLPSKNSEVGYLSDLNVPLLCALPPHALVNVIDESVYMHYFENMSTQSIKVQVTRTKDITLSYHRQ